MAGLKLPKLRERTLIKLTISVQPDLHAALLAYAALYRETYGAEEPISELIPAMLAGFLESDRVFAKARKNGSHEAASLPRSNASEDGSRP